LLLVGWGADKALQDTQSTIVEHARDLSVCADTVSMCVAWMRMSTWGNAGGNLTM
jgi:hypothetical protein